MVQPVNNGRRGQSGPPDLVAVLRGLFSGSGGTPSPGAFGAVMLVLLLVVAAWGVLTSFYTVQPEERAVVKRFGAVIDITDPGLHFRVPFGIDQVQLVATERVLKQEFGFRSEGTQDGGRTAYSAGDFEDESLMLTGDLNMIEVEWVVQYRIADPIKFLYEMREPTRTLQDISESVMRRIVGNMLSSEVLTIGRVEIQSKARDESRNV
ncbi:MAG: protease modulator HflK [Thioalkalivibrio sp.]|nr:protease modulator HflK [Thioalkalivibrio sp.]